MKWKPDRWTKSIPEGGHGRTSMQKRYWKLVSDYVRIYDFYNHGKKCATCDRIFTDWKESQAGHFKAYGSCNSYFKFDINNLCSQCANCNAWGGFDLGDRFKESLKERRGQDVLEYIEKENLAQQAKKLEDYILQDKMQELLLKFEDLPEQPDYWSRAMGYLSTT